MLDGYSDCELSGSETIVSVAEDVIQTGIANSHGNRGVAIRIRTGAKLRLPVASGVKYVTLGFGMTDGSLLMAVTIRAWLSPPAVTPLKFTVCSAASSLMTMLPIELIVGRLFTGAGRTVIVNVCVALVSTPPFAVLPSSMTFSVTVAEPATPVAGVYVRSSLLAIAGAEANRGGLLFAVTLNESVWPASFVGPVDRFTVERVGRSHFEVCPAPRSRLPGTESPSTGFLMGIFSSREIAFMIGATMGLPSKWNGSTPWAAGLSMSMIDLA